MIFPFYIYFLFLSGWNQQQRGENACGCVSLKTQSELYRAEAKYENDFSKYPEHSGIITSAAVRGWEKTYKKKGKKVFESSPRMKETPEDSIYSLSGYIYQAKMNANDCDLHLEIGTENPNKLRIVAEITKDNCKLQEQIIQLLKEKNFVIGQQNLIGVKCNLKGLGFYDGKHPKKKNKKYEKGCAWEIHPVISIELE